MRILIILLFISFSGFSQTYDDIMSIDSKDAFIKVMIENSYNKKDDTDENFIQYSSIDGSFESSYSLLDDRQFVLNFFIQKSAQIIDSQIELPDTPYDRIYDEVKEKCSFDRIMSFDDLNADYACYQCDDAKFDALIGFTIVDGMGIISIIRE